MQLISECADPEWEDGWLFSGRLLRVRPNAELADGRLMPTSFTASRFYAESEKSQWVKTIWLLFEHRNTQGSYGHDARDEGATAIAAVLSDMDAEIEALERRLAKTHALKQGIMRELFTGGPGWWPRAATK